MAKAISKTLVIGLGGTGQSVIRDIKKRLFRRYGEIPPLVKFLSFDTDDDNWQNTPFEFYYGGENKETRNYNVTKEEFKKISRPPLDVLMSDSNCQRLNFEQLGKIYSMANGIGANGFRVMGRAHVLYNANSIMQTLVNTITNLRNASLAADESTRGYHLSGNNGITVYIIASLAGGTGSSSFLDFSRMLQHAGIDIMPRSTATSSDKILGMFFMPSFFVTKPNTSNVRINTYIALSELDYLLSLNDREKYPDGCAEIEADRTGYGTYQDYKSVRFSNVYLIDEKTKNGNSHSFDEAAGYVASFIAASIAADNQALNSCYSNSKHSNSEVEGKKQLYSGLGFCEIRFDRQNLVKYLLNRHLRDILADYQSGDIKFNQIADNFISDNSLNEGVMSLAEGMEDTRSLLNELTDSIYKLEDKRFTSIVMAGVETGKAAAAQIEANKRNFLERIMSDANEAIKDFKLRRNGIITNLDALLSKHQTEKGFVHLPNLAKCLRSTFESMRDGLVDEIKRHEQEEKKIEENLKKHLNNIQQNTSSGFLGLGSKLDEQSNSITQYRKIVGGDLKTIKLEVARKNEAVSVYDALINRIENYYKEEIIELGGNKTAVQVTGSAKDTQLIFDDLMQRLDSTEYAYSKAVKNETIFVNAYFKEYFDNNKDAAFTLTDQSKYNLEQYIKKIFQEKPQIDKDIIEELHKFILAELPDNALVKLIQSENISIDELFIHCFGKASDIKDDRDVQRYPQLGLFGQMAALFDSLWQYEDFCGGEDVQLQCVVGVHDITNHLLDQKNGYKAFLPDSQDYQYINVGDPDRILFILQETAIPAFKMSDANVWRGEYNLKKDNTYSFTDKNLEDIPLLFPDNVNESAEIAWAYGWLFGLIASVKGRIQVKVTQEYLSKNNAVLGNLGYYDYFAIHKRRSSDLAVCKRQFIRDDALYTDIYNQVIALMDSDKPGTIVKIAHWVNDKLMWDNRGKLMSSMDEAERLVIQNEPMALEKRFVRLSTPMTGVKYNKTLGKIEYTDSLGILQEAEKAYQESVSKPKSE